MLFSYAPPAAASNWFHECMAETVKKVHQLVEANTRNFPTWPSIAPAAHHAKLQRKTSLRDSFKNYFKALKKLTKPDRDRVFSAFENQNKIADLLAHSAACDQLSALPSEIRTPARNLFESAFGLLDDLNIRDEHFDAICRPHKHGACPFCGYETINDSGGHLDHYLLESVYPFAGVNLMNLPFMGHDCNSKYKLKNNMLWKGTTKRYSFNPFAAGTLQLSLDRSEPFAGDDGELPKWEIDFTPQSVQLDTWLEVFKIKERYKDHLLDRYYKEWIGHFLDWAKDKPLSVATANELVDALGLYAAVCDRIGLHDRSFVRAAVYRMLQHHCRSGNQRLIDFIIDYKPT